MAYMLVGDPSFKGGHTDGLVAFPTSSLTAENFAKL